ncbi:MAG: folylpolyglutamate synthase/dihydrofolate synthase family protein [Ilumatobacteraceae bacterium]
MNYLDALAYLDEHASYEKTGRVTSPTLEPITRLVQAMGDPQDAAPVIHITGTNGKGSTAQMVTRLLMAQGLHVGTYTSPHLERINERFMSNAEPISDEDLAEQIAAIADLEGLIGVRPSYFEACTAAAFRWFADTAVDVAVVEVGLLGRWDATNIVNAQVAAITNIGMDHNEFAGPTLADVAREKAGIIKPGSAAVIGELDPDLVAVLCEPPAAVRLLRGVDFETAGNTLAVGGRLVDLRTPTTIYPDVFVPLHGAHQGDNASLALTATEAFFASPLAPDVVEEGFANVSMPGRFEVLGYQPLVIVDGAHNPPGADSCAQVFFEDFHPEGRRILIIGTLREPTSMLEALRADEFDVVIACTAPSPRGVPVQAVARAAVDLGCDEVLAADTVREACQIAMRMADGEDAILATGSLYTAGEARPALIELSP